MITRAVLAIGSTWLVSACDPGSEAPPSPEAAVAPEGSFSLLYRDDFDALDGARWQLMNHSWDTNLALFSPDAVAVEDGNLVIRLLEAPPGTVDSGNAPKRFLGAEVRSRDTLTYGRVRARAKFASGSAVVSSLVTIYTPWPADNWNELDIECLGSDGPRSFHRGISWTSIRAKTFTSMTSNGRPQAPRFSWTGSFDTPGPRASS